MSTKQCKPDDIEKGHKTCLVKTNVVYEPVGEKSSYRKNDDNFEKDKFYSSDFYKLTDYNPGLYTKYFDNQGNYLADSLEDANKKIAKKNSTTPPPPVIGG